MNSAEAQTAQVIDRPAHGQARTSGSRLPELERDDRPALLSVRELSVRFGPLSALDAVNLDVHQGELVAVAGENGAGKTTLVACVAGDIAPSSGRILLDGRALPPRLRAATRRGVAIVRQHTELCGNLDIAANLFLGREGHFFFDRLSLYGRAGAALEEWKIPLPDLSTKVSALSGGMRQLLTVAARHARPAPLTGPGRADVLPRCQRGGPGGGAHRLLAPAGDDDLAGVP